MKAADIEMLMLPPLLFIMWKIRKHWKKNYVFPSNLTMEYTDLDVNQISTP